MCVATVSKSNGSEMLGLYAMLPLPTGSSDAQVIAIWKNNVFLAAKYVSKSFYLNIVLEILGLPSQDGAIPVQVPFGVRPSPLQVLKTFPPLIPYPELQMYVTLVSNS